MDFVLCIHTSFISAHGNSCNGGNHIDSDHEESEPEAGDSAQSSEPSIPSSSKGTSNASEIGLGKRKFLGCKRHFIALLDACDDSRLGSFTYKALFSNSGPHLIYDEQAQAQDW